MAWSGRRDLLKSMAPDLPAMESNLARRMRPKGWSRGKASWKQTVGGLPPGLNRKGKAKRTPQARTGMPPHARHDEVTNRV